MKDRKQSIHPPWHQWQRPATGNGRKCPVAGGSEVRNCAITRRLLGGIPQPGRPEKNEQLHRAQRQRPRGPYLHGEWHACREPCSETQCMRCPDHAARQRLLGCFLSPATTKGVNEMGAHKRLPIKTLNGGTSSVGHGAGACGPQGPDIPALRSGTLRSI